MPLPDEGPDPQACWLCWCHLNVVAEWISALAALGVLAFGVLSLWNDRSAKRDARLQHIESYLEDRYGYRPLGR